MSTQIAQTHPKIHRLHLAQPAGLTEPQRQRLLFSVERVTFAANLREKNWQQATAYGQLLLKTGVSEIKTLEQLSEFQAAALRMYENLLFHGPA